MTLDTGEFIRRILMHVLPSSFHRIRHVFNNFNSLYLINKKTPR